MDSDSNGQMNIVLALQPLVQELRTTDDLEGAVDGTLGVILMSLWLAEVNEEPVA